MSAVRNSLYPVRYGNWAGNPKGNAPDYDRCCAKLHDRYHPGGYQCTRKRGHGPDEAYCKQHDPAAVKQREAEARAKFIAERNRERVKWFGPTFLAALRQIADGHNDPRTLAKETIETFEKGALK